MSNWRTYKTLAFVVMAFIAAGLLGFGGINLEEKAFNLLAWKYVLVGGVGYLAWVFKKLLNI